MPRNISVIAWSSIAAAGLLAGAAVFFVPEPAPMRDLDLVAAPAEAVGFARKGPGSPDANRLPASAPREVTLVAVGDLMLSRTVGARMRQKGYGYPYAETREWLADADITFGNLETAVTPGAEVKPGGWSFRADPESVPELRKAGFDILSLANNHTPNFGKKGLLDTFAHLSANGIRSVGAGEDDDRAWAPAYVEAGGRTFAFIAANDADVVPAAYGAAAGRAGTALMDAGRVAAAVAAARAEADTVIVSMHSGTEYVAGPNARQTAFAHAAIDAGADMVIGHHPHVVQTAERYKGKWIFYSLGNFVFDQMWSEETRRGLGLAIRFGADGEVRRIALFPVRIEDAAQPRPADGEVAEAIIRRLGVPFETTGENVYILSDAEREE